MSIERLSRRKFFFAAGLAAGSALIAKRARGQASDSQLRIAFVGCSGLVAPSIISMLAPTYGASCPCYADVDAEKTGLAKSAFPKATYYSDYRQMLDRQAKDIDAVMVNVPDHHHYPVTLMAMQLGKHVYTQKPLTHTVWEARQLALATAKYKVATQMGNQNHAGEGNRMLVEYVRSGMLGQVREAHAWTNRPLWPQGGTLRSEGEDLVRGFSQLFSPMDPILTWPKALTRPAGADSVPESLNWDCWLGPAPTRPYKRDVYHPVLWRGWRDFGTGALGDEAPHLIDGIFWAMDAKAPLAIEPVTSMAQPLDSETYPGASVIKWEFGPNEWRPGFLLYFYERGLKPALPPDLEPNLTLPESGALIIGSKATLLMIDDAGNCHIIPETKNREMGRPPKQIEPSPGHLEEWLMACKGEKPLDFPKSSFTYAGALTETILLGNIALCLQRRIEWDAAKLKVTNLPAANQFVSKEYRSGWKFTI